MASGAELVDWYEAHKGIPYSTDGWMAGIDGADEIRSDCSGTQAADYRNVVGVSCPNLSWTQAKWCYDNGGRISVEEARNREPGTCWLFMGANAGLEGWGPSGHVALVRGTDSTLETPAWGPWGHASGIGRISGRGWTGAGIIPGLGAPAPAPAPTAHIDQEETMIHVIQDLNDQKGVWIYNGVRISPEAAFDLAKRGVQGIEMLLVQFDRGLLGTVDPNNNIEDAPWFGGRLQELRGKP